MSSGCKAMLIVPHPCSSHPVCSWIWVDRGCLLSTCSRLFHVFTTLWLK